MQYARVLPSFQLKRLNRILTVRIQCIRLIPHRDRNPRGNPESNRSTLMN
jgi:hypothetical protein